MDYPERGKTHHVEAESRRIFEQVRPENWIVRQTTERDYGIDAYVELVTRKDEISGEIFFVQLKETKAIEWSPDDTFSLLHWLGAVRGFPIPRSLLLKTDWTRRPNSRCDHAA